MKLLRFLCPGTATCHCSGVAIEFLNCYLLPIGPGAHNSAEPWRVSTVFLSYRTWSAKHTGRYVSQDCSTCSPRRRLHMYAVSHLQGQHPLTARCCRTRRAAGSTTRCAPSTTTFRSASTSSSTTSSSPARLQRVPPRFSSTFLNNHCRRVPGRDVSLLLLFFSYQRCNHVHYLIIA